jgi:hypothetical protein
MTTEDALLTELATRLQAEPIRTIEILLAAEDRIEDLHEKGHFWKAWLLAKSKVE